MCEIMPWNGGKRMVLMEIYEGYYVVYILIGRKVWKIREDGDKEEGRKR